MFDQFQTRYPTGSLTSELLQIHQEKFIVRVAAIVEGVTRATGMAAAETVEQAEDEARSRALMVLGIASGGAVDSTRIEDYSSLLPVPEVTVVSTIATEPDTFGQDSTEASLFSHVAPISSVPEPDVSELQVPEPIDLSDTLIEIDEQLRRLQWHQEQESVYLKRAYGKQRHELLPFELLDFLRYLKLMAQTSNELERLKWNAAQGREHLLQNYNKKGRSMLSYEQLLEFLKYLESQPTPSSEV